jgi:excisionase family DNA binding protein
MPKVGRALSVEQAGEALGVSSSTVWRMIRRGELPTVRERGRRLVLADAVARHQRPRQRPTVPPMTTDHPIFRLIGAGRGGGQVPGARDKHAVVDP